MPLTAKHRNDWIVDSTNDEHWVEVHVPGYPDLLCPECRGEMRARKETDRTRRHFYHLRTPEWCSFSEESPQHLHTKAMVAAAVRELNGWTAEIEFTGDGWRADVLATSPSGSRRIAWEPQFSAIPPEKAAERTRRHEASGVETLWLDARGKGNLDGLPRVRLRYQEDASVVTVWALRAGHLNPYKLPLARFVQAICLGNLVHRGEGLWVSPQDVAELARLQRELERQRAEAQRLAEARAELNRKYTAERQGDVATGSDVAWEQARALREAEEADDAREREVQREREAAERTQADRERAEQEARERAERTQADRERAEQEARERAERDRAMREDPVPRPALRALGDWQADPSLLSDVELANLARAYARAERPAAEWVEVMERVQAEIEQRHGANSIM